MWRGPVLPQELLVEILSWVPVKTLMRFRCVSKTWNSLIFDPTLVKLHLQRSSKNTHILLRFLTTSQGGDECKICVGAAPCSIRRLLENPSSTIDHSLHRFRRTNFLFGACNGLVSFLECFVGVEFGEYKVRFWNPATRIMSQYSPRLRLHSSNYKIKPYFLRCGFGFDDGSDNYKVVAVLLDVKSQTSEVRVHCLGDTCWRKTLACPVFPMLGRLYGQFASGTLNWLALRRSSSDYEWRTVTVDELVIFSYDLKNETFRNLLMPNGLVEVPVVEPYLGTLNGCLCLSHYHGRTHFVVWLMREFGVEKSWTQLVKVSYEHLQNHALPSFTMIPLCMSQDEDVLLLEDYEGGKLVLYNRKDNRIDHTEGFNDPKNLFFSYDYVESLVLPYRN